MGDPWGFGWDAIGALATTAATLVALFASVQAIRAPQVARKRERLDAAKDVIHTAERALALRAILAKLAERERYKDDNLLELRSKAGQLNLVLTFLVSRPSLTDLGVAIGAGAKSIVGEIGVIPTHAELAEQPRFFSSEIEASLARYVSNASQIRNFVVGTEAVAKEVHESIIKMRSLHRIEG